ncbi:MAG: methyltransferase domain-containing protein [Candidatus Lokiarchaeota archaeon]|nr:methyltransferase domain-containing protein [Candidatus Lokiarchaeota archaeon]
MFLEEAKWIKLNLFSVLDEFITLIDIGSSSQYFRTHIQPYIESELFEPLKEAGKLVTHMDSKSEVGVDIVLDIEHLNSLNQKFDVILCCNVLEHVKKPLTVLKHIKKLLNKGGFLVVTIPFSYPYHCDPYDNLWRPSPSLLVEMLPEFTPIEMSILKVKTTVPKLFYRSLVSIIQTVFFEHPGIIYKNFKMLFQHPFSVTCTFFHFDNSNYENFTNKP